MAEQRELPTFPDILPSSVKESLFHRFEDGNIRTEAELNELVGLLYDYPERDFYYFRERAGLLSQPVEQALRTGIILDEESELFWYKHPTDPHDYVRIQVRDGNYEWDWQKMAVEKSPMFVRMKLQLSERTRRDLEIRQTIETEREAESNPIELKPGIGGFSIDLFKAYHWIRKWLRRRRAGREQFVP